MLSSRRLPVMQREATLTKRPSSQALLKDYQSSASTSSRIGKLRRRVTSASPSISSKMLRTSPSSSMEMIQSSFALWTMTFWMVNSPTRLGPSKPHEWIVSIAQPKHCRYASTEWFRRILETYRHGTHNLSHKP